MGKIGRNQRCPCGSGKKYKHCCLRRGRIEVQFSAEQRALATTALAELALARFEEQRADAAEEVWGEHLARADEIADHWGQASEALLDAWFWFDRPLDDGRLVVDALLGTGLRGPAAGLLARVIQDVNGGFPHAKVVAVDMPSGMPSDSESA